MTTTKAKKAAKSPVGKSAKAASRGAKQKKGLGGGGRAERVRFARVPQERPTVGERIIEGLEQAVAWTRGENDRARVTVVQVPEVNVRDVRQRMGLSQAQFATKFGFPPATLRNWEQGRARPDASTRVLLAVIDEHPEAVEAVLAKVN
jgi:putative transcriptional regulator